MAERDLKNPELCRALLRASYRTLGNRKPDLALAMASRAVAAMPGVETLLHLADLQSLADRGDEAKATLRRLEEDYRADLFDALPQFAIVQARLGDMPGGIRNFQTFLSRRAAVPAVLHYILGSMLAVEGRFAEANEIFDRGLLISCGDGKLTCTRIIHFPDAIPTQVRPFPIPRAVELPLADFAAGAEAVYFVCCDARYFGLFGEPLCNALLARAEADLAIHIHIVNPTPDSERTADRLCRRIGTRLAISRERTALDDLTQRERRTYYSCARFLILPELLRRYGRPMLVADADQIVLRSLRPLLADFAGHDIGLLKFPKQISNIFSLLSATALLVADTEGGRSFCDTVADTLAERFADPAAVSWHLDQTAMVVAHLLHPHLRTWHLSPSLLHSELLEGGVPSRPPEETVFWSITASHPQNMAKLTSPDFLAYLSGESEQADA
ncbi:tetratricopeptide repeat protein [Azospirillum isscasi]|uniref:Uncharacterized protein n=1 Tax=Azospirillum isscasi TaxID=3053926 RepID=A0ABU0WKI7_9PROT|nr:hypothetical protein [Azospirillum isscasi]MDQ2104720.1 hypothetical protein [Azospirillum isscasi]